MTVKRSSKSKEGIRRRSTRLRKGKLKFEAKRKKKKRSEKNCSHGFKKMLYSKKKTERRRNTLFFIACGNR